MKTTTKPRRMQIVDVVSTKAVPAAKAPSKSTDAYGGMRRAAAPFAVPPKASKAKASPAAATAPAVRPFPKNFKFGTAGGELVKELLLAGWKLNGIAGRVGLSSSAVRLWAMGIRNPTEESMAILVGLIGKPSPVGKPPPTISARAVVNKLDYTIPVRPAPMSPPAHRSGSIKVATKAQASALARVLKVSARELEAAGQLTFIF